MMGTYKFDGVGWSDPDVPPKAWSHYEPGDARFDGVPRFDETRQMWVCTHCGCDLFTEEERHAWRISFEPDPARPGLIDGYVWVGTHYERTQNLLRRELPPRSARSIQWGVILFWIVVGYIALQVGLCTVGG